MHYSAKIIVIDAYDNEMQRVKEKGASYFVPKPLSKRKIDLALKAINFV